jgi:endonuclease/exonuclease/phosphatase family metal-dependent hydrolase
MRVLSWNLFHGRSVPDTPRELLTEFGTTLGRWEWDVALLQEVPPWWAEPLARATGSSAARVALTSRNQLLGVRAAFARRRPDLLKSNGGGANAILVRPAAGAVVAHERHVLRRLPERRVAHAVALRGGAAGTLAGSGDAALWVGNLHASQASPLERARQDGAAAAAWLLRLGEPGGPRVLGGDLNDREPLLRGLGVLASSSVDHLCATEDLAARGTPDRLRRAREVDGRLVRLSDHVPLAATLRPARTELETKSDPQGR